MRGLVMKSTGSWYDVQQDDGQLVTCRLRGQFRIKGIKITNPVVVGDWVTFYLEPDGTGTISKIEPRRNYIERKSTNLSKISHVIAANIDVVFLIVTLKEPRTSLGFIDRFLVSAESFRIPTCIVFNKMDLYDEQELELVGLLSTLYSNIGYDVIQTSTVTGLGLEQLKEKMKNKVCLFSGHSGTGKTAIIQHVDPSLNLRVGEISKQHLKGKHTTTFAEMFPVADGYMMDTPGIKEFGLINYSKEEIRDYFPEIRSYNNKCKFNNCIHHHEPGCAVKQAVEMGLICETRYTNYLSILLNDDMKIADWQLK